MGRVPDLLKPSSVSLLEKHSPSEWVAAVRVVNTLLITLVGVEVEVIPEFSVPAQHWSSLLVVAVAVVAVIIIITVLQEELEGGPPVETASIFMVITAAKVGPRARAARQVMAGPQQAHPLQAVTVGKPTTGVEELEVLVGRMEVGLVVTVIIIITYMQAEVAVVPGILGAGVEH
jgi:hypothetical protein